MNKGCEVAHLHFVCFSRSEKPPSREIMQEEKFLATSLVIAIKCVVLIVSQSIVILVFQVIANLSIPGTGPIVVYMNIVIYIPIVGIPKF